jgi:hypothetical protein
VGKYEIGPAKELAACFAVAADDECWESGASVSHCSTATATSNDRLVFVSQTLSLIKIFIHRAHYKFQVTWGKRPILGGNPELAIQVITLHNNLTQMSNDLMSTSLERAFWKMGFRIPLLKWPSYMLPSNTQMVIRISYNDILYKLLSIPLGSVLGNHTAIPYFLLPFQSL